MHTCRLRTINDHYHIDSHSLDNHYRYGNVEGLEHNEPDAVHCSAPEHTEPETLYSTADDTISAEGQITAASMPLTASPMALMIWKMNATLKFTKLFHNFRCIIMHDV